MKIRKTFCNSERPEIFVNDATEQLDNGVEGATEDQTMGFYTQDDIPSYYRIASSFALNDRYFASVLGPTFPEPLLPDGGHFVWPSHH